MGWEASTLLVSVNLAEGGKLWGPSGSVALWGGELALKVVTVKNPDLGGSAARGVETLPIKFWAHELDWSELLATHTHVRIKVTNTRLSWKSSCCFFLPCKHNWNNHPMPWFNIYTLNNNSQIQTASDSHITSIRNQGAEMEGGAKRTQNSCPA